MSVDLIEDAPKVQILPFVMPGRFFSVRQKQAQPVMSSEPPPPPTGTGAAYTALSHVDPSGSPEMNAVTMPPPYEETQGNRIDAPRALKR
jgi:hypothetical protein